MSSIDYWLGVDAGGTFTDFVLWDGASLRIHKVLSTPDDPARAILQGLDELSLTDLARAGQVALVHGSTVATNAALERKGVPTAYVTNTGLEDVLTLGRQNRVALYDLCPQPVEPPVPSERCFGVNARTSASGEVVERLEDREIASLVHRLTGAGVESVAINLLFSYLDDQDEKRLEAALTEHFFVSRSSWVLPESGEYERGIATWLNAWLGPRVQRYLQRLEAALEKAPVSMMQSSGGTIALDQAGRRAVNLLLSGPAGGLAAGRYLGRELGEEALLTFDMGGTSTDVALVGQDIRLTSEGRIGPWPVAVPMVAMHTIGAGGGSLIALDQGGLLQVGPESAGASPGPACYGQGGRLPTVTDANLLLGRLPGEVLGGDMQLDREAARQAMAPVADALGISPEAAAEGALQVANEHMARALRTISVQKGEDPTGYRLCSFGGAGGLHVCALAEALGMHRALVPVQGGVLSALGMLVAPRERQLSRSWPVLLDTMDHAGVTEAFHQLEASGTRALLAEGVRQPAISGEWSVDLRYQGQSFTLNLPWQDGENMTARFHEAHKQRYGHGLNAAVELVNLRVAVRAAAEPWTLPDWQASVTPGADREIRVWGENEAVPLLDRNSLSPGQVIQGPCVIAERVSTTWLAPGWAASVHAKGHLLLEKI